MNQSFPGPLSPEELARAEAYYGGAGVSSPAAAPAASADPGAAYYGAPGVAGPPPPPPVDAGPYYNYSPAPDPVAPPAAPKPFSWNAPGFEDKPATHTSILASPAPRQPGEITRELPAAGPPKPPTSGGETTPAEDAQFRALVGDLNAKSSPKKAAAGGSGGGKPANPDPYGVKAANAALLGTYDAQKGGMERQAGLEGQRSDMRAGRMGDLAQQQRDDAEIHAREVEEAQRGFDSHMAELQQQVDTVRNEKIDPDRLMKQDGMGIRAIFGGIMGGLYMGINHLDHNPFLDDLNKQIDRDIAVQEKNLDTKQKGVADSMNLLREQRATFKDNDLAKLATKRAMYEATQNGIEAEAAKYDSPLAKARSEQAIATIDREKDTLDKQIKEHAMLVAQQQAAAGAAQQRAALVEKRKAYADTYDKVMQKTGSAEQAETEAARQMMIMYGGGAGERPAAGPVGPGVDPVSKVPEKQVEAALKERQEYAKAQAGAKRIDDLFQRFDSASITEPRKLDAFRSQIGTTVKQHAGQGMSSDDDFVRFIEPNLPKATDSADTLATKRNLIRGALTSSAVTPTLDQHAPGWRGPEPVKQYNLDGTPKN